VAVETRARRASDRKKSRAVLPIVPGRTEAELMIVTEPTWRSYVLLLMALDAFILGGVGPRATVPPPKLRRPANDNVASCPASELRRLILRALDLLLLLHQEFGQQAPYVIRHSGGSATWLCAQRTRRSIQDRGR